MSTPQNRVRRRSDGKVRVAIVGVGNCASSLVQGVEYYKNADPKETVPGLMHVNLGGYHIRDIEFVAAFDVDKEKVGKDLSDAIFSGQNNTIKFSKVPKTGVKVHRGMTHDGIGKYLSEVITKAPGETADVVQILKDTKADVIVSYLPVGSEEATKWYVEQALAAGVAFVNNIPVFIARESYWAKRFKQAGLPIIGDDIKSQVGATITHRMLATLFEDRTNEEEHTTCDVGLAVDEHRGNRIENKPGNRDLVGRDRNARDAGHDAGDHAACTVCVFLLKSFYAHGRKIRRAPTTGCPRPTNGRQ